MLDGPTILNSRPVAGLAATLPVLIIAGCVHSKGGRSKHAK